MTPAPADNWRVMSDRQHDLRRVPGISGRAVLPMAHLDPSPKSDLDGDFGALKLPGIAGFKPVLWVFVLPAILHGLAEQSVVVANAISERRHRQRRHALHEAGSETAESAVAEGGVGLDGAQVVKINTEIGERGAHRLNQLEIGKGSEQLASEQELERQIIDALGGLDIGGRGLGNPTFNDAIADNECGRYEPVPLVRGDRSLADGVDKFGEHGRPQGRDGASRGRRVNPHIYGHREIPTPRETGWRRPCGPALGPGRPSSQSAYRLAVEGSVSTQEASAKCTGRCPEGRAVRPVRHFFRAA